MSANKWIKDLSQGNIGEKVVASWLSRYKDLDLIKFNDTMDYDFVMERKDGSTISFEVKTDRYEFYKGYKTGNIFIETRCNGKKSGLWGTIADMYCFYFPDFGELYFIKTEDLRSIVRDRNDILVRTTLSGDGGKVSGFLIDRYKWRSLFKYYDIPKLKIWSEM
jgi:hypothetical protein